MWMWQSVIKLVIPFSVGGFDTRSSHTTLNLEAPESAYLVIALPTIRQVNSATNEKWDGLFPSEDFYVFQESFLWL